MMRRFLAAVMVVGLLASCAKPAGDADPATSGGGAAGDQATGSQPVQPVGGDLREGQPWFLVATSIDTLVVPPDVTMTFQADSVAGQGPVNAFSAGLTTTDDGAMTLGPIASTRKAGPEDLMAAEDALFELLARVDGYTALAGGELYLFEGGFQLLTLALSLATGDPEVPDAVRALAEDVVGMSEADAEGAARAAGCTLRVVERDGEMYAVTQDYRLDRVNVTIADGVVTAATVG